LIFGAFFAKAKTLRLNLGRIIQNWDVYSTTPSISLFAMNQDKPNTTLQGGFSSLLGKIKGVLLEEEPPDRLAAAATTSPSTASTEPSVKELSLPSVIFTANPMVENLMSVAMRKATAYTALVDAISPLESFIPDEASRYKAAFAIVGKTRTLMQIMQAIDMQHAPAVDAELQVFKGQATNKEETEITAPMGEITILRKQLEAGNQEGLRLRKQTEQRLQELQAEAVAKTQKIAAIEQEISIKREAIAHANRQFDEAVAIVKDRLEQAKTKVMRHLSA
jgi:hypothetical protein